MTDATVHRPCPHTYADGRVCGKPAHYRCGAFCQTHRVLYRQGANGQSVFVGKKRTRNHAAAKKRRERLRVKARTFGFLVPPGWMRNRHPVGCPCYDCLWVDPTNPHDTPVADLPNLKPHPVGWHLRVG